MMWLTFRQYRTEFIVGMPVLLALLALFAITGSNVRNALSDAGLNGCLSGMDVSRSCLGQAQTVFSRYDWFDTTMTWLNFAPAVIGAAIAAPLVVEFEQRTYRLAWTQSVGRTRWLTTKLGVALLAAVVVSGAITLVATWAYGPTNDLHGRWGNNFNFEGTVFISYTVFALAIAVAVGTLAKRAFPSFVVTVLIFFAVRIFVENSLRPEYLAPKERLATLDEVIRADWIVSEKLVNASGAAVTTVPCNFKTPDCSAASEIFNRIVYHPADRFWLFQGIESAIFVAMSLLLLAATAWWVRHRMA